MYCYCFVYQGKLHRTRFDVNHIAYFGLYITTSDSMVAGEKICFSLAASFTLAGILLTILKAWVTPLRLGDWQWLHAVPLGELGGTLFDAGCCRRSSNTPSGGIRNGQ